MIYLEPRHIYDEAIINDSPVTYDYEKLIDVLCKYLDCEYLDAVDFYCYNIEPLKSMGLKVND